MMTPWRLGVRASTRLASAGRRALARGDFPAAANLLDRAARLLDDANPQRAPLLVSAGEAYMEIGEFATADDLLVVTAGDGGRGDRRAFGGNDRRARAAAAPPSLRGSDVHRRCDASRRSPPS